MSKLHVDIDSPVTTLFFKGEHFNYGSFPSSSTFPKIMVSLSLIFLCCYYCEKWVSYDGPNHNFYDNDGMSHDLAYEISQGVSLTFTCSCS